MEAGWDDQHHSWWCRMKVALGRAIPSPRIRGRCCPRKILRDSVALAASAACMATHAERVSLWWEELPLSPVSCWSLPSSKSRKSPQRMKCNLYFSASELPLFQTSLISSVAFCLSPFF